MAHNPENTAARSHAQTDPSLWEIDAYCNPLLSSFDPAQPVTDGMYMSTQPYLANDPLSATHTGFALPDQGHQDYAPLYYPATSQPPSLPVMANTPPQQPFYATGPSSDPSPTDLPSPPLAPFQQQALLSPTASQDQAARRRATTCPVCFDTKGSARDVDRHIWAHHRDYATEHQVPSEERRCPHRHCPYVGRKDNLNRHIKAKHRGLKN